MKLFKWSTGVKSIYNADGKLLKGNKTLAILRAMININIISGPGTLLRNFLTFKGLKYIQWSSIIFAGFIVGIVPFKQNEVSAGSPNKFLIQGEKALNNGNLDNAKLYLDSASEEYPSNTNKASYLLAQIDSSGSKSLANTSLLKMSEENFQKLQDGSLEREFINNEFLNAIFIDLLKENADRRSQLMAEAEEANRQQLIWEQFVGEEHAELKKLVKMFMENPESYQHVKTTYADKGDYLMVRTVFREKNAVGTNILNYKTARFTKDGEFIGFIDD